ncbi:MAG: hypothetical protein AAGD38_02155 [Acidobacteriota bacterium]
MKIISIASLLLLSVTALGAETTPAEPTLRPLLFSVTASDGTTTRFAVDEGETATYQHAEVGILYLRPTLDAEGVVTLSFDQGEEGVAASFALELGVPTRTTISDRALTFELIEVGQPGERLIDPAMALVDVVLSDGRELEVTAKEGARAEVAGSERGIRLGFEAARGADGSVSVTVTRLIDGGWQAITALSPGEDHEIAISRSAKPIKVSVRP